VKRPAFRLLLTGLLLWTGPSPADEVEVIELRHRPAEELIPLLRPMIDETGSLTGQGFRLIIRSSPADIDRLRQLVERLDSAPRQLLISVFQGSESDLQRSGSAVAIEYSSRNPSISTGKKVDERGGGARISGSTFSTRARSKDAPIQQLRIREGAAGHIETGQSIPYFSSKLWLGARRSAVQAGIGYKDVSTGFYVRPRVHGDRVTLDISPYKEALSPKGGGIIDTQSAATTVTGPLGQWIEVGGSRTLKDSSDRSTGSTASTRQRNDTRLWIKAELIK